MHTTSSNPEKPLIAGVLNDAQLDALNFYRALNVPAMYYVGVSAPNGTIEVIAIGADAPEATFVWSLLIEIDGTISANEAELSEFRTGIDV